MQVAGSATVVEFLHFLERSRVEVCCNSVH